MTTNVANLSRAAAKARLERGEQIHMELRDGARLWWFEAPLAIVPDKVMSLLLFGQAPVARVMEAGDSLFGLPMNSQTWLPCVRGEH